MLGVTSIALLDVRGDGFCGHFELEHLLTGAEPDVVAELLADCPVTPKCPTTPGHMDAVDGVVAWLPYQPLSRQFSPRVRLALPMLYPPLSCQCCVSPSAASAVSARRPPVLSIDAPRPVLVP